MILPNYKDGSILNLMSTIQTNFGQKSEYNNLKELSSDELKSNSIIIFTIDGLGHDYVENNKKSFLFKNLRGKMTTVFPSSTAPAVTTFFTGVSPAKHNIMGWYMYAKEIGTIILPFPYLTRLGRISAGIKLDARDFFTQSTIFDKIKNSYIVVPEDVINMDYNKILKGKAKKIGYKGMNDFIRKIKNILEKDKKRKFIYAYYPDFDMVCHIYGKKSRHAAKLFKKLDKKLDSFTKKIKDTSIIVTSDHGHIDTDEKKTIILNKHPEILECLERPLSGEPRAAYCYIKIGKEKKFEKYIGSKLSHACELYRSRELANRRWFGPEKPSKKLLERIGDYVLVMKENYIIKDIIIGEVDRHLIGNHGGTSAEEMFVPLIVIKK